VIEAYLEAGQKRVFACAVDWPGWSRSGRDEASALRALVEHGPRYARVAEAAGLPFLITRDESNLSVCDLSVIERLAGDASTDFGAPGAVPSADARPFDAEELRRSQALLSACWQAFDAAVAAAKGRELSKGPRGGGRDAPKIVEHVLGGDRGYLSRLAWRLGPSDANDSPSDSSAAGAELTRTRRAILDALAAAARGELPTRGPRGGAIWPPRYFVRRSAWHVLDHAWEIEDRMT
jgi:hypothetical protein